MRAGLWAIVSLAIWALAVHVQSGAAPVAADAAAGVFSAARAQATLKDILGPELPHPAGTPENAAVHARVLARLAAMGVPATTITRMSCTGKNAVKCATITDIIADVVPGPANEKPGPAIVLMAHLDSVPAGPGASDDGAGVATLLETIRALKATPAASRHPVTALFTDGEEDGLLGASAFIRDPVRRARVGLVVNVDARGDAGESLLFQTSPGDAHLIDLYAQTAPHPATSSVYREIYKYLHNDTDLTPVLEAGVPGYNFANVANVPAYHTPLDRLAGLDPRTLQSHGDNVLALTRGLEQADFSTLKSGDAIYLDVLGLWLPRLPVGWALPLSLLAFAAIAVTGWRVRAAGAHPGRWIAEFLMPPLFLLGAAAVGYGLQFVAAKISGQPDPTYAHPAVLRAALALGVGAAALLAAQRATFAACWLWLAGFAIAAAWFLPGLSPYYLFPSLVAALVSPFAARRRWLILLPALAALLLWLPLAAGVEMLMGLIQAPLFALIVAMGLIAILPFLRMSRGAVPVGAVALAVAVAAGFAPTYDAAHPQPLNRLYVEQGGKATVLSVPVDRVPIALRAPARFPQLLPWLVQQGFAKPVGAAQLQAPTAALSWQGSDLVLDIHAGAGVVLVAPKSAAIASVSVNGVTVPAPAGQVSIFCSSGDCAQAHMVLRGPIPPGTHLVLMEWRHDLPPAVAMLLGNQPPDTTPVQFGNMAVLMTDLKVPAR